VWVDVLKRELCRNPIGSDSIEQLTLLALHWRLRTVHIQQQLIYRVLWGLF